jgi:hypothetical protein
MNKDDDRELTAAFSALRREEQEQFPAFAEVVRRGRARSRRSASSGHPRLLWAAAAAIVLAVLAAWLGLRLQAPAAPAPSLAEWRSPTDFLLETPGQEILAAPTGWSRSVLDLGSPLPSSERRSPS